MEEYEDDDETYEGMQRIIDNLVEDNLGLQEKANYWIEMARSLKNEIDFLCEYAGLQPVWCDTIKLTGIPHTPISPDKFRNTLVQYLKNGIRIDKVISTEKEFNQNEYLPYRTGKRSIASKNSKPE